MVLEGIGMVLVFECISMLLVLERKGRVRGKEGMTSAALPSAGITPAALPTAGHEQQLDPPYASLPLLCTPLDMNSCLVHS